MNANQFYDKVASMRQAQRDYFQSRSKDVLHTALRLEKEVDQAIAEHEMDKRQASLNFEEEGGQA